MAPALVIVVALVGVIVRVQPSSVLSDRLEPLIEAIVMSREPPPRMPTSPPRMPKASTAVLVDALPGAALAPDGRCPGAVDGAGDAPIATAAPRTTSRAVPATTPTRTGVDCRPGPPPFGAGFRGSTGSASTGSMKTMSLGSVISTSVRCHGPRGPCGPVCSTLDRHPADQFSEPSENPAGDPTERPRLPRRPPLPPTPGHTMPVWTMSSRSGPHLR